MGTPPLGGIAATTAVGIGIAFLRHGYRWVQRRARCWALHPVDTVRGVLTVYACPFGRGYGRARAMELRPGQRGIEQEIHRAEVQTVALYLLGVLGTHQIRISHPEARNDG